MRVNFLKNIAYIIPFAIIALLIFAGSNFEALNNYELDSLDLMFRIRPGLPITDKAVIIEIGDDTVQQLGRFPFDRSYHAALIKALTQAGAKAVILDIFFSEPHSSDAELEQAIASAGNIYLPFVFELDYKSKLTLPVASAYTANSLESFRELAKGTGHINVIPDSDGKFRRVPMFIKYRDGLVPYLSFLLSCDILGIHQQDVKLVPGKNLKCGSYTNIPLDKHSNIIVNYAGYWAKSYKHYSYVDVVRSYIAKLSGEQPLIDLGVFKDKVCIVGLSAAGTTDLHPSPFEPLYPSVGIHADIINSIIQKKFISRASRPINLFILLIISLVGMWVFFRTKPLRGFYALLGISIIFVILCVFLFVIWGIWVDVVYPVLALVLIYTFCTLRKYLLEWKKRLLVENELQIAQRIQESFLPKALPKIDSLDIAAVMYMAREVGGDIYDFCEFSPKKLGVMIGDVSGKGIPASLFMSCVSGAFKFFAVTDAPAESTLDNLNMKLMRDSNANLFVTMFYAVFDTSKRVVMYANGGHLPVLYAPRNSPTRFLDVEEGLPLGMLEGSYSGNQVNFSSHDIFVFYTDGITEAVNKNQEMYGKERLLSVVEKNRGGSAQDLLKLIERDVRKFEPKKRQRDDITLIVIKIT
jgi:CHASE2 domain-containing sensor protein